MGGGGWVEVGGVGEVGMEGGKEVGKVMEGKMDEESRGKEGEGLE